MKRQVHYGLMYWDAVGLVMVAVSERGVVAIELGVEDEDAAIETLRARLDVQVVPGDEETRAAREQLSAYFAGERRTFDLNIDLSGLSEFQQQVLQATRDISYGEVLTYGEVAARIGKAKAARAVGQALARNPIPLVIPCHRVRGADGSLGGFSAVGGVDTKQTLLELERQSDG